MTTTTKLALYDVVSGGKRIGTLELSDLSVIKSISYGQDHKPEDNSHVVTIQLDGSSAPLIVRALDGITNAQFIQNWCDAVVQAPQSEAYSRNAVIVEDRTLLASASATPLNNNNVLAALIADLQERGTIA